MRGASEWIDEGQRRMRQYGAPVIWLTNAEADEIAALCGVKRRPQASRHPDMFMGVRVAIVDEPPPPFWRPWPEEHEPEPITVDSCDEPGMQSYEYSRPPNPGVPEKREPRRRRKGIK